MPQSSLTAWLQKPVPVAKPDWKRTKDDYKTKPRSERNAQQSILTLSAPLPPSNSGLDPIQEESSRSLAQGVLKERAPPSPGRPLPANVDIRSCTKADIPAFRQINSLLLPVAYPDSFYREILNDPLTANITQVATWHDDPSFKGKEKGRLIGAIRCRLLGQPVGTSTRQIEHPTKPMLYLSTLVLLSPYRSHGIATHLLNTLVARAINDHGIGSVGAHVWEANAEGLEWYRKRGFRKVGTELGYYRKLEPSGAILMRKEVGIADLLPSIA
ncbi:hypothetical protein BAUCODRAFT_35668 [Baudoinia panamericana UAMH 10762]|uniref:N-acetyltransferase domain-containing protein n=1 Tax=Baudoinia panamericana (strain UAMH 10762) TaxID=717646 RepID=M2MSG6_BAUPA|nr:uncharacterized protein BAUCODRAFT_35668 [Baudoinia panamericana UAMH 10762]EMC94448.1 hypothetical protein BAUCODRAFT_35668 [Baudoinia panamericana UAMH 10762]